MASATYSNAPQDQETTPARSDDQRGSFGSSMSGHQLSNLEPPGPVSETRSVTLDAPVAITTLHDVPDWRYLLREYDQHYRFSPAGGSKPIRAHMRTVRERLTKVMNQPTPLKTPTHATLPVTAHLARALDNARTGPMESFARAIEKVADRLHWQYGYEKMPRSLTRSYGFADIAGPDGPIVSPGVVLGLVLFAPRCTYPAHRHDGIDESYICVSGAMSENDAGVYVPGSMIFNSAGTEHTITTSDNEPVLLAYAWTGSTEALSNPKMVLSKKRRGKSTPATIA